MSEQWVGDPVGCGQTGTVSSEVPQSLFERLGGADAVTSTVVHFYEKVMVDDTLTPFFDGLDMDKQIEKQIAFMTMALGGPHGYDGRALAVAHKPLVDRGLNDGHFDAIARHLGATLSELGVPQLEIEETLEVIEKTRDAVLGRNP